jgi:putative hydrolase of the HAD superfamily
MAAQHPVRAVVDGVALARLGYDDEALADRIADAFTEMRRNEYRLYPDAHATVDALRTPA